LWINDFQQRSFLQNLHRLLWVGNTWEFHNDLIISAGLDERLADSKAVYAALQGLPCPFECLSVDFLAGDRSGFEHNLQPPLQIEPLPDRVALFEAADVESGSRERNPARKQGQHDYEHKDPQGWEPHG